MANLSPEVQSAIIVTAGKAATEFAKTHLAKFPKSSFNKNYTLQFSAIYSYLLDKVVEPKS
jgi:hypothetical protein